MTGHKEDLIFQTISPDAPMNFTYNGRSLEQVFYIKREFKDKDEVLNELPVSKTE
jgi:hypothetical protein